MEEDKKLISVIVPIYNVREYLEQCIESVINQTYANIEVILIDDGSKDKSGTVVLDEIKVISVYAKNDEGNPESIVPTQNFINSSRILYIDPNKKRTDSWLTGMHTKDVLPWHKGWGFT